MNKRTVFGAATLLLAVGAATTFATLDFNRLYAEYRNMFFNDKAKFGLQNCANMKLYLDKDHSLSTNPPDMLEQLKAIKDKPQNGLRREFATRLLSYTEPDCATIKADEFLAIVAVCGDLPQFEAFVNFLEHYGITKFEHCSGKMLASLQTDKEMLSTRLKELTPMFKKTKINVDTHTVEQMLTLAWENTVPEVLKPCTFFQSDVFPKVSTINVALALDVVEVNKLAPEFPLLSKCAIFCAQYVSSEIRDRLVESDEEWDLETQSDESSSSHLR